jgi:monofunctional biosynthetic peptidoglycan transglycosylase
VRRALALVGLGVLLAGAIFWITLPDVSPLATSWPKTTAFMERRKALLAASGKPVRLEWTPVPLSRISKEMQRAAVVAEDARFFEHDGVDWTAMREAAARNLEKGGIKVGGSTITQQLAKNLYLSPARTPLRKLRELAIARRLERQLTKKRILELYLNVIEFGTRTFGVEAASRRYFGKPASELSREEAATLAAVIPSPRIFDPKKYPQRVAKRAQRILRWM